MGVMVTVTIITVAGNRKQRMQAWEKGTARERAPENIHNLITLHLYICCMYTQLHHNFTGEIKVLRVEIEPCAFLSFRTLNWKYVIVTRR